MLFKSKKREENKCSGCDGSVIVEMDGPWRIYRVCVREGHVQVMDDTPSPLSGVMLYPARG